MTQDYGPDHSPSRTSIRSTPEGQEDGPGDTDGRSAFFSEGTAEGAGDFEPGPLQQQQAAVNGAGVAELEAQLAEKRRELAELEQQLDAARGRSTCPRSTQRPLSIVIPMGGLGDAFAEAGFRFPRPLVNIVGRPVLLWLLDHLSLLPQDVLLFVVPAVLDRQHGLAKLLTQHFPSLNMRVITLPFGTRGWAETVFAAVRQMSARELRQPLVTLDCSTIYHGVDLLAKCRNLPEGAGASVYFDTAGGTRLSDMGASAAQFSYLRVDKEHRITEIKEKTVISSMANAGAYIFGSARSFRAAAEKLLESPEEASQGGLYASVLISSMLERRERFVAVRVEEGQFAILATPLQLETFIRRVSSGRVPMPRKMRFCFDLDGTLVTEPRLPGDLATCEPIPKAIELVRQLHAAGHVIIITTCRGMATGCSVDSAVAHVGLVTFTMLSELGIPYHELHFGKPYADVYIDSRSLNTQVDVERDLGWHVGPKPVSSRFEALDGAIDARSFNLVRAAGKEHVIKSSKPDILRGECHWYRSIPPALVDLFPRPLEVLESDANAEALSTITMTKVPGVTFSHLATMRLLMKAWVRRLMHALHRIHTQQPPEGSAAAAEARATNSEICHNYATKVSARTAKHLDLYDSLAQELGIDTRKMATCILGFLEEFEAGERAQHAHYIHGDPVFSNVIRSDEDQVVLIDMRGELGGRLTTQGDVHYDLSKVYQSLCGYDFMLLDQAPDVATSEVLDGLRAVYWEEVRRLYPDVQHRDVRLHTAAHFFTIVPLHEVRSRMARYLRQSQSMLLVEGLL